MGTEAKLLRVEREKGKDMMDALGGYSNKCKGMDAGGKEKSNAKLFSKTWNPDVGLKPEFNQSQGHTLPSEEGVSLKPGWDHHGEASKRNKAG